jgi:hypothetical protein
LWLADLSEDELRAIDPWKILTDEKARGFLIMSARDALRGYRRFGLAKMTNEEILHEVYPLLHGAIAGILANCAQSVEPENRDRFIYGSLRRLIRCRLAEQVFGSVSPSEIEYIEELPKGYDSEADDSYLLTSHSLMHPYLADAFSYLESRPDYQPQFLSEAQIVPEERVQIIHRLIEHFRHYLTHREVDVLRNLLLSYQDRSMVALEIGTTPKMVSRYRLSIQNKMKAVLVDLGWSKAEVASLLGKTFSSDKATV